MSTSMKEQIEAWLQVAKKAVEANSAKKWPTCDLNWNTIRWTVGPKYFKVIVDSIKGGHGSAFIFIDFEGNIYKPAGAKGPAKGIRGNISTVDATKLDGDIGWLYRR